MKLRFDILILLFLLVLFPVTALASTWAKSYGGSGYDNALSIQQTSDGGFIVAGKSESYGAGDFDCWVLKLDAGGHVMWQKRYGGAGYDAAHSIQQTSDGGFIVAGFTDSYGAGLRDAWILKLDANGNVIWQRTYGGSGTDEVYTIQQTTDGGFIVAGHTDSSGAGGGDVWILKLDASGTITWQKTYGGSSYDVAFFHCVQQTSDGGFIVAGVTFSGSSGNDDFLVFKIDANGNVTWQKTYDGPGYEGARSVQQTSDGGFIVAGYTTSDGAGSFDHWVFRLDANGKVIWQKTYGDSGQDVAWSIQQTKPDGGFIVAGYKDGYTGTGYLLYRLYSNGNFIWPTGKEGKTYTGSMATSVQQTSNGGFIASGRTKSYGAGNYDYWIVKTDANGDIPDCDIIHDISLDVNNTTVILTSPNLVVEDSDATVTSPDVDPMITDALVGEQCYSEPLVIDVDIDIKPGSDPNCFNINGHGVIPVAINGSEDFSVYDIDVESLSLGGLVVRVRGNRGPLCSIEDWNEDGHPDLVCHFDDDPDNWVPGGDSATLTGALLDGTPIEGTDSICIVP